MTKEFTPVLFRADRSGAFKAGVTAVFPTLPAYRYGLDMMCYTHIGQHSSCSPEWLRSTRVASPIEYKPLQTELEGQGYRLKVCKRISPSMREEFTAIQNEDRECM